MSSKLVQSILLGLCMGSGSSLVAESLPSGEAPLQLEASERETKKIQSQLRDLSQQLRAISRTATEPGLGPQLTEAKRAFANAQAAFSSREWPAVIQESSRFLSLSQKPEVNSYLRAQHMIGRAYEEQGQHQKAIRAYRRYLATFTTNPKADMSDLSDTFERIVRLATKTTTAAQSELSKFLSSIASMEYPSEIADELKYFSAVASSNIGKKNLASDWLSDVNSATKNPETKARAKQYKALIAIHKKDYESAAAELESLLQIEDISQKSRDNAQLALARVFIKQKKPQLGLASYGKIQQGSDAHKDAAYEKTLVLAKLGRDDEARKNARAWLSRYQGDPEASHLKGILSWLDLRAGDLEAAKKGIGESAALLSSTQQKLQSDFSGPKLTYQDATRLSNLTNGLAEQSPDLGGFLAIFTQLAEMKQRLAEVDGAERSLIYTLASGDLRRFSPAIANRIDQYDRLADQVLSTGAKLIFIERQRLAAALSDVDKQKLASSQKRREALFDKMSKLSREFRRWSSWIGPAEQLVKLSDEWKKINKLEAELNAKVIASPSTKANSPETGELVALKDKISKLRSDLMTSLVQVKRSQAQSIVDQSNIDDILYIIQQYGTSLHEDSLIISKYEPKSGEMLDALADEDSRLSWTLWRDAVAALHEQLKSLRDDAAKQLNSTLASLDKVNKTRLHLEGDIDDLTSVVETYGGESLGVILSHYDNELNQRLGRQYKWAGDLEYLNYVQAKNDQEASAKKLALEKQILSDSLRETEQ